MSNTHIDYISILAYFNKKFNFLHNQSQSDNIYVTQNQMTMLKEKTEKEIDKINQHFRELLQWNTEKTTSSLNTMIDPYQYVITKLRYRSLKNLPVNISVIAEVNNHSIQYRVSLDSSNLTAGELIANRFHSYLELPKSNELLSIAGRDQEGNLVILTDDNEYIQELVRRGIYEKVELSVIVKSTFNKTNDQYEEEIIQAIKLLEPYYQYATGQSLGEVVKQESWLLNWNSEDIPWNHYQLWTQKIKAGGVFTLSWQYPHMIFKEGDKIYLLKNYHFSKEIIAYGTIVKINHYDDPIAKKGYFEVSFDWIQDDETEQVIPLELIKEKFPQQDWTQEKPVIKIEKSITNELEDFCHKIIDESADLKYWPALVQYDPGITRQQWITLLNDPQVTSLQYLTMLKMMLVLGGEASCFQLASKFGNSAAAYNAWGISFAKRVYQKTKCPLYQDGESLRYYTIPFVGRETIQNNKKKIFMEITSTVKGGIRNDGFS